MSNDLRAFEEIGPGDVDLVGGKGLSLGLLTRAGLPVPPGFCVAAPTQRRLRGQSPASDGSLVGAITDAYQRLGGGPVAVRSSATAEDGEATSFAGQQETYLGIIGEVEVLGAVGRCWDSLHTERARAYRERQGVEDSDLAMAVVIQRLIPAEVAGVLFTRDPLDSGGSQMLVEASWGLGESVVSGRVTPDRYHMDRETGAVVERHLGMKATMIRLGAEGTETVAVPRPRQDIACLDDHQLRSLAELGRRVEAYYSEPRDVEWAYFEGRFWLLQARPITAVTEAEREEVRQREVAALREKTEMGGTVWGRFNLAEVLPTPTPMTWAIVRRFMSGRGGFGLMYRDLGFDPDPALDEIGIFDLICGRPYCNLSRQLRLQFRRPPLEYPFAALKAAPEKALYPQPVANPSRAGARFWLMLPIVTLRLSFRIARLHRTLPNRLRRDLFPAFAAECDREATADLSQLNSGELLERLELWIRKTLYDFARDSLKPTALAGMVLENLERKVARAVGPERVSEVMGRLTMGVHPDPEADLPAAMEERMSGRMEEAEFLRRFGHRGSQEMELAQPRWSEQPPASGGACPRRAAPREHTARTSLAAREECAPFQAEVEKLHTYLALRETGKHYLMKGYALIRRILVELDRRCRLNGGIFFLVPDELPRLVAGENLSATITKRRRDRTIALSLEVPQVIFSDDLMAIGRPVDVPAADTFQGVPLSAGVAEGLALVLREPTLAELPDEPFILVCPSTDPAWVPLFVRAGGLVMETGGVLSHGAIVAREFGLPAVAGIPGITGRLRTGQRVRVDGVTGRVSLLEGPVSVPA